MRRLARVGCGLFLAVAATLVAQPQSGHEPLPRRAWLGVAFGSHERGAAITGIADGSPAAEAGLRVGDVVAAVDGAPVRTPDAAVAAVVRHRGGESAALDLIREGQPRRLPVALRSFPVETMPGVTFEYGSVMLSDGSRLRTILSVPEPRTAARPAVMLLQGGGCGSVDIPMAPDVGQGGLIRTVAARGYVTMRVEKSGVGDSQGPPCADIGYTQELDGYRAALVALRRHPSVDPDRISLLGISLGGVFAPLLAGETAVRGIVVYGTLARNPPPYPGRSERFFREFAAVAVPAAWSAVESRVLVLRGEFDDRTTEADHARIAAVVNARSPGRAAHRELAGLDHCWTRHATMDESRGNCGTGHVVPALSDAVLAFLSAGEP